MALRVRPGERTAWITLPATADSVDRLRQEAKERTLPVDVVAALLLEWGLCADVGGLNPSSLAQAARQALGQPRLAPHDDLRAWERQLAGHGPGPTIDELPEICVPQRLTFRLPPGLPSTMLDFPALDVAILCERAACRCGTSLELWVLRRALAG